MNNNNNFDMLNDELHDDWLSDNLKLIQVEPPADFTKKVVSQIEIKPNPLSGSPLFWILSIIPLAFLAWLILFALNTVCANHQVVLSVPDISSKITLLTLSKYMLMIVAAGLFFIGLDSFLNKRVLQKESFFNTLLV